MSEVEITAQEEAFRAEATAATDSQFEARDALYQMYQNSPLPPHDLMFNLGMYTRSSLLVKFLVMNDLYARVKDIPGCIMEFGVWYGQNLVLMENLRAIHEPFNKQRRIVGFDTFSGYLQPSNNDKESDIWKEGVYETLSDYKTYLKQLLEVHEQNNVIGHVSGCHELIEGDVSKTVPEYVAAHPEVAIAMLYFDIGFYEPTVHALRAVKPHLMPGAVILLDEFTWSESPGEAIAFKEVFSPSEYAIEKCALYPSKAVVTYKG